MAVPANTESLVSSVASPPFDQPDTAEAHGKVRGGLDVGVVPTYGIVPRPHGSA